MPPASPAGRPVLQIEHQVLHAIKLLIPVAERLHIHAANRADALPPQICHQMAANEATTTTHHGYVVFHFSKLLGLGPRPRARDAVAAARFRKPTIRPP